MKKADTKKILLLFDDRLQAATMSQILLLNKYEVVQAKDRREAITVVKKTRPDLIIVDSQNKETDKSEILKSMRSTPQARRIPFLIVVEAKGQIPEGDTNGPPEHSLVRPFTREQLAITVQKILKRS